MSTDHQVHMDPRLARSLELPETVAATDLAARLAGFLGIEGPSIDESVQLFVDVASCVQDTLLDDEYPIENAVATAAVQNCVFADWPEDRWRPVCADLGTEDPVELVGELVYEHIAPRLQRSGHLRLI